jgi:hypothetical protein
MSVDTICRRGTPRGAARLKLCCSKGFRQGRPVGLRRQRIPVRRYVARHPHVAKRLPRSRGRMSPAAGFQIRQRWCNAERVRVAVIGLDMLDGMGPRCRLRKAVRAVVRAQRGPGDQCEKQGQRTNDRRGVFSPPSLCTTAPVHCAEAYKTRPGQQRSTGCEIAAHFWGVALSSGTDAVVSALAADVQSRRNRHPRA